MRKSILHLFFLSLFVMAPLSASAAVVSVKPGPFPDGMDTWFGSNFSTTAQHDNKLVVGGWGDEYDSMVRFNLAGLPQVATQAIVWLYSFPAGGTPISTSWNQVSSPQWHSGTITYSAPMSGWLRATYVAPTPNAWYGIDVTTAYNQWRSGASATPNYGYRIKPTANNNNFDNFYSSGTTNTSLRPQLDVYYTPQTNDSIIKLKWYLEAPAYASRHVNQPFGVDWSGGTKCPDPGPLKKHNGTDFAASAGTAVYAAEDGIVKESISQIPWGHNIVIESTSPTGAKYTTVYWHVDPVADVTASNPGGFIPKGMKIATVADLGGNTHSHIGVRIGSYAVHLSGTGALPTTTCTDPPPSNITYPAFPAGFVDPNNTGNIIFQ